MCALNTVCWHSFQQSIFIQRGPDAQVKITNLPGCVMNLCVCVCEEKWVRTFKIQDKISHIEASFLLQTVLICILQRPWLVAVFQIWWWIIHLHSRGFVCERVCVCVLKTLRLVSCRFPLRIKKQRSLPVHRPAGRVDQPGEPVQPGPGRQTTRSHILSGPGGEQSWCFSSGFFFYFLLCYAAVRCWGAILTMYSYVLYSWSLFEQIEYFYFGKSLTMENGTNKKKKRTTLIFFFKGGDIICWGGTSLLNKSRGGPPPPRCAPVVFLLFLRLLFLVERCWKNYCVCSSFVSLLFCPSVSFFCKLWHFFACSNYFPISLWLYGTAVLEAQDSFVVLFFLFFFYSRGHKWWWWWWW